MAPRRASLRLTRRNKRAFVAAALSRVVIAGGQFKTVCRLKNGLLDVASKCVKHLNKTNTNSKTHLLQLPAEIRNHIWEYALGGKTFDVVFNETSRGEYIEKKATIAAETVPKNAHSLLRVCRQIYAETALVPFSCNAFRFSRKEAFSWVRDLLPVQQNSIREVHLATHRAERLIGWVHCADPESFLPESFPVEVFPNIKRVVVKVGDSPIHDLTAEDELTVDQYDQLVEECTSDITAHVKAAKPDAEIVFDYVDIKDMKRISKRNRGRKLRTESGLIYQDCDERWVIFFGPSEPLSQLDQQLNDGT